MCVAGKFVSLTVCCCIVCDSCVALPARAIKAQSTDFSTINRWQDVDGQILTKDSVGRVLTASRFHAFFEAVSRFFCALDFGPILNFDCKL
jgi:hypothetical protein